MPEEKDSLKTPQKLADELWTAVDEFLHNVMVARDLEGKTPPSERIKALICDVKSLLKGIATGEITTGQPRLASNLIQIASELEQTGHFTLAGPCSSIVESLSVLSAENCSLGRIRSVPSRR